MKEFLVRFFVFDLIFVNCVIIVKSMLVCYVIVCVVGLGGICVYCIVIFGYLYVIY